MAIIARQTQSGVRYVIDWWPQGRNGKRVRQTLPPYIQTMAQAKAYEEEIKRSTAVPREPALSASSLVRDAFLEYLQWYELHRAEMSYLDVCQVWKNHLKRFFGHFRVSDITESHIDTYKRIRRSEAIIRQNQEKPDLRYAGSRTINKELSYLSGFLKWCRTSRGMACPRITVEMLPYKRPVPIVLSIEEVLAIVRAAPPHYQALYLCLYGPGLRSREARRLRPCDVDYETSTARVIQKGGSYKLVPLPPLAVACLKAIEPADPQAWYFPARRRAGESVDGPVTTIRKALLRHCRAAGVTKRVTPHLFRHSIATHLLGQGANLRTLQQLLGHAEIATTEWYTHVDIQHVRDATASIFAALPQDLQTCVYNNPGNIEDIRNFDYKRKSIKARNTKGKRGTAP